MYTDQNQSSHQPGLQSNVIKAHQIWGTISPQIKDLLGEEVYLKWFDDLIPLTIQNQSLVLQANAQHSCLWIKNNYQETLDLLSTLQEENLRTSIIAPGDEVLGMPYQH